LIALAGCALAAPVASASFHLVSIRAVHAGTGAVGDPDYVELQMYAPGQNLVGGHTIRTYDGGGGQLTDYTLPANVGNGDNQRTILIANGAMTPTPDATAGGGGSGTGNMNVNNGAAGGAVCWAVDSVTPPSGVDCVSYGAFPGFTAGAPSPTGTPAAVLENGNTLVRTITPNCLTALDAADDTNNSAADFSLVSGFGTPRNNATTPTEQTCPETSIDKGPKKKVKTKKKKAKVTFKFSAAGATSFECKLDKADFELCSSPDKLKAKKGKHSFQVRGINSGGGVDPSPATQDFKVKRKK
jgi:hypothetical protein